MERWSTASTCPSLLFSDRVTSSSAQVHRHHGPLACLSPAHPGGALGGGALHRQHLRPGWIRPGSCRVLAGGGDSGRVDLSGHHPAIQVNPQPLASGGPCIEHSIQFTREAWGLDEVEYKASRRPTISKWPTSRPTATIDNLRIWDPSVLPRTYQSFQELRNYYPLSVVDTDRYPEPGHTDPGHAGGARARGSESAP